MFRDIILARVVHYYLFAYRNDPLAFARFDLHEYKSVLWDAGWTQFTFSLEPHQNVIPELREWEHISPPFCFSGVIRPHA